MVGALFIRAILLMLVRKCYYPLDKMNYGVYEIQDWVKSMSADGARIVAPRTTFQSEMTHDHIAIKKIPIEKLAWRHIIVR
jgi:hypothetical protein